MTTKTPQNQELDSLESVDELVSNMRVAIKNKIDQINALISEKQKNHKDFIRLSHQEASKFIADHLKNEAQMARKKLFMTFEGVCYLSHHHDVPQLAHSGNGSDATVKIDIRKKPVAFNPLLYTDPIEVIFAFQMTDSVIEKFADECAAYFECPKSGAAAGELLSQTTEIVNDLFGLETKKKVLNERFESLMQIPEPPKEPEQPRTVGEFLILPRRNGKAVTITTND